MLNNERVAFTCVSWVLMKAEDSQRNPFFPLAGKPPVLPWTFILKLGLQGSPYKSHEISAAVLPVGAQNSHATHPRLHFVRVVAHIRWRSPKRDPQEGLSWAGCSRWTDWVRSQAEGINYLNSGSHEALGLKLLILKHLLWGATLMKPGFLWI